MYRLICCFSINSANTSRAINAIGARNLTLLKSCEDVSYEDIDNLIFNDVSLESLNKFKDEIENKFDEIYFSIGGEDLSRDFSIELDFFLSLNVKSKKYIIGDKLPQDTLELAKQYSPFKWLNISEEKTILNKEIPIYAMIGVYNEDDIIYATVKNAFMQGCERVFLIDNCSQDNTVSEAKAAGAEIYKIFKTEEYDELYRIRLMNDAIEKISLESNENEIWWLWLDADEFPQASETMTIKEYLKTIPSNCRVVGAQQINHFPYEKPYYKQRFHPFDYMPYGEEYKTDKLPVNHCFNKHWKHPLYKYEKSKPFIRAKSGFHMAYCEEILFEPETHIELHHFPYRDEERTKKRYGYLCDGRNNTNDKRSPNNKSAITKRYESIEYIYMQEWDKVYINPVKNAEIGINPKKINFNQPIWYKKE